MISVGLQPRHSSLILSEALISSKQDCFWLAMVLTSSSDSRSCWRSSSIFLVFSSMSSSNETSSDLASSSSEGSQSANSFATATRFSCSCFSDSCLRSISGTTEAKSSSFFVRSSSSAAIPSAIFTSPSLRPSCSFIRHSYHMALLRRRACVLTFLNWLSMMILKSGDADMYSRNSGGFSSNVSDSISRTIRLPSEIYFLSSRQDYGGRVSVV